MLLADASVSFFSHVLNVIIVGLGLLLVLTILIQRGKGGGLVGAFGGAGGPSAFGSKAGGAVTPAVGNCGPADLVVVMEGWWPGGTAGPL